MASLAEQLKSPKITLKSPNSTEFESILTPDAIAFLAELHQAFDANRVVLLSARAERQAKFDAGDYPDFLPETRSIRETDWQIAPIPELLQDRRVEITGPVERKMIINALNSNANVFMADFEDSASPTWRAMLEGQINLRDAVDGTISFTSSEGKHYALKEKTAVLFVRPRGWHLPERHLLIDDKPISASLFDLGLFAFHNAKKMASTQRGPFFYLPKMQSHHEAKLWDEVFAFIEVRLGLAIGTMKATILIETLPAAFEMDEFLYAMKSRVLGLNCGRWDYIFSYLKVFRNHRDRVLPERSQIGMTQPFLKAYADLLIQTCHRRGAIAMGGMAAQIPIANDDLANARAMERVKADKLREVLAGHDGTWVAHPGLIPIARQIFDAHMSTPNQIHLKRAPTSCTREQLIEPCIGSITRTGFLNNVDVCVRYLAAWLDGLGCVPIHHLMEDAATAEISRAQLWQWLHHGALKLEDGAAIDFKLFDHAILSIGERLPKYGLPGQERLSQAAWLLAEMTHAKQLAEFLTLPAYELLNE